MPRWDVRCDKCAYEAEYVAPSYQSIVPCPVCGAPLTRLPAVTSFVLKGSGFYKNDYKKS